MNDVNADTQPLLDCSLLCFLFAFCVESFVKKAKLKIKNSKCISKWSLSRIWHYNSSESAQWFDEFMPWYNESQLTHTHMHTHERRTEGWDFCSSGRRCAEFIINNILQLLFTTNRHSATPHIHHIIIIIFFIYFHSEGVKLPFVLCEYC